MDSHRAYEITGVKVGRFVLNGVYEDTESGNAWLGQVFTYAYEDAQDVQPWPGPGGGMLAAPPDWKVHVVRFLGAYA